MERRHKSIFMARNREDDDAARYFDTVRECRDWIRQREDSENWYHVTLRVPVAIDYQALGFLDPDEHERRAAETKQRDGLSLPEE